MMSGIRTLSFFFNLKMFLVNFIPSLPKNVGIFPYSIHHYISCICQSYSLWLFTNLKKLYFNSEDTMQLKFMGTIWAEQPHKEGSNHDYD